MSLKMDVTRRLLRAKKEINKKRLTKTDHFSSIYDVLEISNNSRNAPTVVKRIALANLKTTAINLAGVNCIKFEPKKTKYFSNVTFRDDFCFLYIHGGGFVNGLALQGAYFIKTFMRETGIKAISVDYSLSPEVVFPTAINQIYDVYLELLKTYKHNKIIVGGESAGGNLALALMLKLKENNIKQPKMAILASGYFDLTNTGESYTLNENTDPLLTKTQTSYMSTAYLIGNQVKLLPPKALSNPLISPIYADLTGLPPMYISVCEDELLYSDSLKVYNNCLRDNVKAKFHTNKNCFHAYLILGDFFLESKKATIDCCNYVKKICRLN